MESILCSQIYPNLGWSSRAVSQVAQKECAIPVPGQRATGSLLKSQRCAQLTSDHDFTFKGLPLTPYLTSTNKSIGVLLIQGVKGSQHPIYYFDMSLRGAKMNCSRIKWHCLTLIFSHYLLAYFLNSVMKSNPLKYLLFRSGIRSGMSGQIAP